MLAFSSVEFDASSSLAGDVTTPVTSTDTKIMLGIAFVTLLYYGISVMVRSDHWHRNYRMGIHRRYRTRRRRNKKRKCSCCVFEHCHLCMPAPLPQRRKREIRDKSTTLSPIKKKRMQLEPLASPSSLMDLVRIQDWPSVVERCSSPAGCREAKMRDPDGLVPLMWACSGAPTVDVIKALLASYPKAAMKRDAEGSTSLHFACHYGVRSIEILRLLIDACPSAIRRRDIYGRSPLWHAIEKRASIEVISLLVNQDPSTILLPLVPVIERRQTKYTELTYRSMRRSKLTEIKVAESQETKTKRRNKESKTPNTPLRLAFRQATYMNSHKRGGKKWEKAALLLQAAYKRHVGSSDQNQGDHCILHAALTLSTYLPDDIVEKILHKYPEQTFHRDGFGNLPLHVALSSTPSSSKNVIKLILSINPKAASTPDGNGRLPVALAIEKSMKWEDGIDALMQAYPEAILQSDAASGLPFFMLSASSFSAQEHSTSPRQCVSNYASSLLHNAEAERTPRFFTQDVDALNTANLSTTYEMLCRFPDAIRCFSASNNAI